MLQVDSVSLIVICLPGKGRHGEMELRGSDALTTNWDQQVNWPLIQTSGIAIQHNKGQNQTKALNRCQVNPLNAPKISEHTPGCPPADMLFPGMISESCKKNCFL